MRLHAVKIVTSLLTVSVFGLAGCGSSSNGSGATLTPAGTVANLSELASTYIGRPNSVSMNFPSLAGTDPQGNALTGSLSITPEQITVLNDGASCYTTVTKVTLAQQGNTLVEETSTKYFDVSDGSFYRMVHTSSSGTTTYVRTSRDHFAGGTVKVGDSGNLGVFMGDDGTTLTATWALNPDFNGGAIFVISQTYSNPTMGMFSEQDSFYLDATGAPTKFGFRIDAGDGTYQVSGDRSSFEH